MYFKIIKKEIVEKFKQIDSRIRKKREALIAIADSLNAELYTRNPGQNEYCEFAGLQFKDQTPKGFCKPDSNGMQKPYQKNKEFQDKLKGVPSVKKQEAMDLLNFPKSGIHKNTFRFGESNFLISIAWNMSEDKKSVTFIFPDKYMNDNRPIWQPPEYAIEILSSEFNQITDN